MSEALYNEAIIAEAKEAERAGRLDSPTVSVRRDNPLCGDRVTLDVALKDGRIEAIRHHTRGCLLTRAAAGLLTKHAEGAAPGELAGAKAAVAAVLNGDPPPAMWPELAIFAPVAAVKSRHVCVLLPFTALEDALGAIIGAEHG